MDEPLYSNSEVFALIENKGIGYAIQDFLGADRIQDEDLAQMWADAKELLNYIEAYLADYAPADDDE